MIMIMECEEVRGYAWCELVFGCWERGEGFSGRSIWAEHNDSMARYGVINKW